MSKGFVVTIFAAGDNENSPAEAVHFGLRHAHEAGFIESWTDVVEASDTMQAEVDRLTFALSDARMEIATLKATQDKLVQALEEMVYETTHLSPREDDGSHWRRISAVALGNAQDALAKAKQP